MEQEFGYSEEGEGLDVSSVQLDAARTAGSVVSFQSAFHEGMERALEQGGNREAFKERADVIDAAVDNIDNLRIQETDAGVLGYAYIGGGDSSIVLSEQQFATMQTAEDARQMQHAAAHEQAHAEAMQLQGQIVLHGKVQEELHLHEGFAEMRGNAEVGMGVHEHRKGQPEETYAEGQRVIAAITDAVGRDLVEKVFTETGDLFAIQRELDKRGIGRREQSYATVV